MSAQDCELEHTANIKEMEKSIDLDGVSKFPDLAKRHNYACYGRVHF